MSDAPPKLEQWQKHHSTLEALEGGPGHPSAESGYGRVVQLMKRRIPGTTR